MKIKLAILLVFVCTLCMAQTTDIDLSELKEKAISGDTIAQCTLGQFYYTGENVKKDDKEAARWYKMAANAHCQTGELMIGIFTENGLGGISKNIPEAIN